MSKKTKAVREAKLKRQLEEFGGMRAFTCPQCQKARMSRPHDHVVSLEKKKYEIYSGDSIELLTDICTFCIDSNKKKYFEPSPADIRKVLRAMKEGQKDVSLEELL